MCDVLLATSADLPKTDEDRPLIDEALTAAGVLGRWAAWDDAEANWATTPTVVRSTWDYPARVTQFLTWARGIRRLDNPAEVLEWNTDKVYLRDLDAAGVPIVPTTWAEPGREPDWSAFEEIVIKPSVGSGSRGAGRFGPADRAAARAHVATLHAAGRTAMVQPYLSEVDAAGETALLYFGGRFSHAVAKGALLDAGVVHGVDRHAHPITERIGPREPSAAELAVGAGALALIRARYGHDLLYARVDLLPGPDGPCVVELELVEPQLFLWTAPGAADRFAAALAGRL